MFDPSTPPALPKRTLRIGEHRLAFELIKGAIREADYHGGDKRALRRREDARAWLRDAARVLSARQCFESLDLNYEAFLEQLSRRWAHLDAGRALSRIKVQRMMSGSRVSRAARRA